MSQRRGERVLGPYRHRRGWQLVIVDAEGDRNHSLWPSEEEALRARIEAERTIKDVGDFVTVEKAIDEYKQHLIDKGNKPKSYLETTRRLRLFFHAPGVTVADLKQRSLQARYDALVEAKNEKGETLYSADTHRNILAESRSFLRWCTVEKRWRKTNPLDGVKGKGRRSHGKPQLTLDEARRWIDAALHLARTGKEWERQGAAGALCTLYLDLRCSEVVQRQVRDLDDDGHLLWIPTTKTKAGRRGMGVPDDLREILIGLAQDKAPEAFLFGEGKPGSPHDRKWPWSWVQRLCDLAKVVKVPAHGMRGLHATVALIRGVTPDVVAKGLGHADTGETVEQSYASPEAVSLARQERFLKVLVGGRR